MQSQHYINQRALLTRELSIASLCELDLPESQQYGCRLEALVTVLAVQLAAAHDEYGRGMPFEEWVAFLSDTIAGEMRGGVTSERVN